MHHRYLGRGGEPGAGISVGARQPRFDLVGDVDVGAVTRLDRVLLVVGPGRGHRVWGGRTLSSDPEWKYVNVRRYFIYLEQSIDRGTQWAVFENNGPRLWANVRETIGSFLINDTIECKAGGVDESACLDRLTLSTRSNVQLSK